MYNATERKWTRFDLWPCQRDLIGKLQSDRKLALLKARQLGITWVVAGWILWNMIYRPIANVLIFSKTDEEAMDVVDNRLKEMYFRLPEWLRREAFKDCPRPRKAARFTESKHELELPNGSRAKAFPTTGGRSYTGSIVVVDEADWIMHLGKLLTAVEPSIDAGGQLVVLSSVDKSRQGKKEAPFKALYQAARAGENGYLPVFYPWRSRPGRTDEWYEDIKRSWFAKTGSDDDTNQEYPATETEALSPRSLDKRIAPAWLEQCSEEAEILADLPPEAPAIQGLTVWQVPLRGHRYVIGADPAEGNPNSDDSAFEVLDAESGEQVAEFAGKVEPGTLADYAAKVAHWFNHADIMPERNNHGHAFILALKGEPLRVLHGLDGRPGWLSSGKGKAALYDAAAEAFRDQQTVLHGFMAYMQLASIEGNTLRAPEGEMDDLADAFSLAIAALRYAARPQGGYASGGSRQPLPAVGQVLAPVVPQRQGPGLPMSGQMATPVRTIHVSVPTRRP